MRLSWSAYIIWFKSFDCYIFGSLFCTSKGEHLWSKENCFLLHFESSFRSWDNQILTSQIFRCHDVIKCPSMNHETTFTEQLGSKDSLVKKFGQLIYYNKGKNFIKKTPWKMWPENKFQALFNFQKILCKKKSEEVCMLIWTNLNSFAINDISSLLQKFHFPIEFVLHSLQT